MSDPRLFAAAVRRVVEELSERGLTSWRAPGGQEYRVDPHRHLTTIVQEQGGTHSRRVNLSLPLHGEGSSAASARPGEVRAFFGHLPRLMEDLAPPSQQPSRPSMRVSAVPKLPRAALESYLLLRASYVNFRLERQAARAARGAPR